MIDTLWNCYSKTGTFACTKTLCRCIVITNNNSIRFQRFYSIPGVKEKIENFDGVVLFTRDTHETNYLDTQEGKKLPVPHCIRDTEGWQIRSELDALRKTEPIDKETFGSTTLAGELQMLDEDQGIESITFVGLCTDICVISNALLAKASLPEVPIIVDAKCCAGVTPESHENALKAMEVCQIQIDR